MNYTKIYNKIISIAQNRPVYGYTEKHHIVPKCLGGTNDISNLVRLTAREHFISHQLLAKIYKTKGLVYAAFKMSKGNKNNSKTYSWLQEAHSKNVSNRLKGIPLSNEHKEKLRQLRLGKKHSSQTKQKMSGKMRSNETRQKISQSKIGIPRSEETKHKVSLSKIGVTLSMKHKQAIKEGTIQRYKDHPVSEETRVKIGNIHRGKVYNEETKRKIGEASKGRIQSGAKHWILLSPSGEQFDIYCLKSFCKEHQLKWKTFSNSTFGEPISKGSAKGWIAISKSS